MELGPGRKIVDGKNVEAYTDVGSVGMWNLLEIGSGHASQHLLLVGIYGNFGGQKVSVRAGFDFYEDEGVAVPGDEVEVSGMAWGAPAARDDGVAEVPEMEEGSVFAAFAEQEMRGDGAFAVGTSAQGGVNAAFQVQEI